MERIPEDHSNIDIQKVDTPDGIRYYYVIYRHGNPVTTSVLYRNPEACLDDARWINKEIGRRNYYARNH